MIGYAVLGGFVLDAVFGDPAWLPHPVVYMGKAISALEKGLRARLPKTPEGELWGGRILAFCLPVGTFAITSLVCMGAAALHPLLGLAQTRIEAMKPYYDNWMRLFPTLEDLAKASEDEVVHAWQGLGYYSRARNLRLGVKDVVENYGGIVPHDRKIMESL